ncbi:MAG: DUF1643 domain-containing protein [Pseudaminobacter sp.]|nr:DUF1643 domain-containing protein [Pseudaminobacter sp.]
MSAVFSECRRYRYRLDRELEGCQPPVAFLLHNPSTADDAVDDSTSRRGIGYARAWGCRKLIFVNPWAFVATHKRDLWKSVDPVGPDNDGHIRAVADEIADAGGLFIGAWGNVKPPRQHKSQALARLEFLAELVVNRGCKISALAINKNGSPGHPLYIPNDATLSMWKGRDSH